MTRPAKWREPTLPIEWDDDEDFEVAVRRAGYGHSTDWGVPRLTSIEIYGHESGKRWILTVCCGVD